MVSYFNGISTFEGYFMPKPFLERNILHQPSNDDENQISIFVLWTLVGRLNA